MTELSPERRDKPIELRVGWDPVLLRIGSLLAGVAFAGCYAFVAYSALTQMLRIPLLVTWAVVGLGVVLIVRLFLRRIAYAAFGPDSLMILLPLGSVVFRYAEIERARIRMRNAGLSEITIWKRGARLPQSFWIQGLHTSLGSLSETVVRLEDAQHRMTT